MVLERIYFDSLERSVQTYNEPSLEKALKLIMEEIQNLPPKCKQVFLLSRREGLTNMEISDYLNISVKTVEAQITKSFKVLRKNSCNKLKSILFILIRLGFRK